MISVSPNKGRTGAFSVDKSAKIAIVPTPSLREWWRVTIIVLLLAIVAGDLGLRSAIILGCHERNPAGQHDQGNEVKRSPTDVRGSAVSGPDQTTPHPWCRTGIEEQQRFDQWALGLFMDLKVTDIFLVFFTLLLVGVGRKANAVAQSQRNIVATQVVISRQQSETMDRQANIANQQTQLIDKQATIAQQTYIATHRARIVVRSFVIVHADAGADIQVRFIVANQGSTDAELLASFVLVALLDQPGAVFGLPSPPPSIVWDSVEKLTGGSSFPHTYVERNAPLHPDDVQAITAGTKHLHVLGMIAYQDDNGARRNTGFFRCYNSSRRRFYAIDDPDFEFQD
jgi:hypothetical protein